MVKAARKSQKVKEPENVISGPTTGVKKGKKKKGGKKKGSLGQSSVDTSVIEETTEENTEEETKKISPRSPKRGFSIKTAISKIEEIKPQEEMPDDEPEEHEEPE